MLKLHLYPLGTLWLMCVLFIQPWHYTFDNMSMRVLSFDIGIFFSRGEFGLYLEFICGMIAAQKLQPFSSEAP